MISKFIFLCKIYLQKIITSLYDEIELVMITTYSIVNGLTNKTLVQCFKCILKTVESSNIFRKQYQSLADITTTKYL